MKLAVLGLGAMGSVLAVRLIERGHDVAVWNRTPGRADDAVAKGARLASSPADAGKGAEAVLLSLFDDAAVEAVCRGDEGALAGLGADAILVNTSTVSPAFARRLAVEGPADRVLDAPLLGGPAKVAAGTVQVLVGGSEPAYRELASLWDDIGASHVYCGPSGAGATAKVVSNLLLITGVAAVSEAIVIGQRSGLSDELLRHTIGDSYVVADSSRARLNDVIGGAHAPAFATAAARKDVRLALELARETGIPVRIAPAAEQLLTAVIDGGLADRDLGAVVEALR